MELCPFLRAAKEGQTFSEDIRGQFLEYTTTAETSDNVGPAWLTDGVFVLINVTYC